MAAGDFSFGGRLLLDSTYTIIECQRPTAPIALLEYPLGRFEGGAVADWKYGESEALCRIGIATTTQAATEAAVDALLKDLYNGRQQLKLGYADERFWLARLAGAPAIEIKTHAAQIIEARFRTATAFASANAGSGASNAAALTLVSGTHYSKTLAVAQAGTIYARPIITITMSGAGPYGTTAIWVVNSSLVPNQQLTIFRAFAANDVIVIDSAAMTVRVNGAEVDYYGQFPVLDPRAGANNNIELHTTSTSVPTLTLDVAWYARFAG